MSENRKPTKILQTKVCKIELYKATLFLPKRSVFYTGINCNKTPDFSLLYRLRVNGKWFKVYGKQYCFYSMFEAKRILKVTNRPAY